MAIQAKRNSDGRGKVVPHSITLSGLDLIEGRQLAQKHCMSFSQLMRTLLRELIANDKQSFCPRKTLK